MDSMDYSDKWLGIAGGGFSGSAIIGGSVYQLTMWNMGGDPVPVQALITGGRIGVSLQVDAGHAVCLLTGVKNLRVQSKVESSGIDWGLSVGAKIDSLLKGSGELVKLAAKGGNWAGQEAAKAIVQKEMGDLDIFSKTKADFVLIPTPASVGIGAGLWYEWQTMRPVGGDQTWRYLKPKWRVTSNAGRLLLRMTDIPEPDGTPIVLRVLFDRFGPDTTAIWSSSQPHRSLRSGNPNILGYVYGGKLYPSQRAVGDLDDGIDLSERVQIGSVTGWGGNRSSEIMVDRTVGVSIAVSENRYGDVTYANNTFRWRSNNYIKVRFNSQGSPVGAEDRYWIQ
ncbi:hypothetical protein [Tabrizicola sp.]|uniref:hypothetical protein n=1 Tax=Tabrizicola sp. TaxID=2005166 RepID=UPI003F2D9D00